MIDCDKNAMYDHLRAVVQHIRGLCEKRNFMISKEFSIEDYNTIQTEIRAACNMAKTCGFEMRLFQYDSFDISPVVVIWALDTTTGEVMKSAVRFVTEYGEIVSVCHLNDFHQYYLKREFNI